MDPRVSTNETVNAEDGGLSQVEWAIFAVWFMMAASLVMAVVDKWTGAKSNGEFVGAVFLYAVFCIVPYKLQMHSNAARYFYAVLFAVSMAVMAAGLTEGMSKLDVWSSWIFVPLTVWSIAAIFSKSGNAWFSKESRSKAASGNESGA